MSRTLTWIQCVAVALSFVLTADAQAPASGFVYRIPEGWIDLTKEVSVSRNAPQAISELAKSGQFVIYAIDPKQVSGERAPVNMNVIEHAGSERVTKAFLEQSRHAMHRKLAETGFSVRSVGNAVVRENAGVDIGMFDSAYDLGGQEFRLRQYVIPGKEHMAIVSFTCPEKLFAQYEANFEAAVMATGGTYQKGSSGSESLFMGTFVGLMIAVASLFFAFGKGKWKTMMTSTASPSMPQAQSIWHCGTCKRRVPISIAQCRCGAARI